MRRAHPASLEHNKGNASAYDMAGVFSQLETRQEFVQCLEKAGYRNQIRKASLREWQK